MGSEMCIRDSAIWLGWLLRQRHRPIHDTAPPTSGPSGYIPSALFAHYRRPSRNLRIGGISEISSAPFANTAFHRLPGDDTTSWTATASLTAFLGDADHRPSSLASPPLTGPKPPVALQLSSTAQSQMTFPIPVHRHPGALPSGDTAFLLPTLVRHHGLPSSRVVFVFVCTYFVLFFSL